MKEGYSSKQKKIYEEYSLYSSDMLAGMVRDKKNHKSSVIRIINDILAERNRGFYTPAPEKLFREEITEPEELPGEQEAVAGEFPEQEDEAGVVYEEVPWLTSKPVYFPGLSGPQGDYVNGSENMKEEENEDESGYDDDEINIEAEKVKYWKCPNCKELVEIEYDVCWNCQAPMPQDVDHPAEEEIIKEIRGRSGPVKTVGAGLSSIIIGVIVLLFDRDKDFIYDDVIRYIVCGVFVISGIFLIAVRFLRKTGESE